MHWVVGLHGWMCETLLILCFFSSLVLLFVSPSQSLGHVYIKYMDEEDAADALAVMNQRFYDGRQMQVEYSPVQNFQEVRWLS
jgi:hypothetical protein